METLSDIYGCESENNLGFSRYAVPLHIVMVILYYTS